MEVYLSHDLLTPNTFTLQLTDMIINGIELKNFLFQVLEIRSVKSKSSDEDRKIIKANRKLTNMNSLQPSVKSRWLHTRQNDKEVTDDSFTEDSIFNSPSFVSFDAPTNRYYMFNRI